MPDVLDLARETKETQTLYGLDSKDERTARSRDELPLYDCRSAQSRT